MKKPKPVRYYHAEIYTGETKILRRMPNRRWWIRCCIDVLIYSIFNDNMTGHKFMVETVYE